MKSQVLNLFCLILGALGRFGCHRTFENTVGSFKIAFLASSAPSVPSDGPCGLARSRWGLRKCFQGSIRRPKCARKCCWGQLGAPSALESAARACSGAAFRSQMLLRLAPEPPVHSERLLGLAPKMPGRSKRLSEPAPQPHLFEKAFQVIFHSACACKCCSKSSFEHSARKSPFECAARNYCSKSHVSVTLYSHPLHTVLLAKCMECTGSH